MLLKVIGTQQQTVAGKSTFLRPLIFMSSQKINKVKHPSSIYPACEIVFNPFISSVTKENSPIRSAIAEWTN